ncbi:hypothetical protein ACINK0_11295 [Deinococcus sp. VB343]|uniref:hypothetical protein n=1 Tax=Deinococcus sp. VB343 TaxID=3385567 RepID=UPI0039C92DDD
MDGPTLAVVRHHVGPDAWPFYEALQPDAAMREEALDVALQVEGSTKAAAAYVLELVAAKAKEDDALTTGPQVKRLKDGSEEQEFFAAASGAATNASTWAARAARLREQVQQEAVAQAATANPPPLLEPWGFG